MRDTEKYHYSQVGIPRTQVLDHLRQEAEYRGVPFATHLMDLLIDRDDALYGKQASGVWFPRGIQIVAPAPIMMDTKHEEVDETAVGENLAAFAGFFDDDDDIPTVPRMQAM